MSSLTDFSVFLWLVLTLLPILISMQQFYYFKTQQRYTFQPVYGSKYNSGLKARYIRFICFILQFVLIAALITALSINLWSHLGSVDSRSDYGGMTLGLINYIQKDSWIGDTTTKMLACNFHYNPGEPTGLLDGWVSMDRSQCFSFVGGSVVVFIFALVSLFLSVYQLSVLQPFVKWNYFVEPQPGQDLASAMSAGIWVRTYVLFVIHMAMSAMYGVVVCAIGGSDPGPSYFVFLGVTGLSPVQCLLVSLFIQHQPPARSRIPPEVELIEPSEAINIATLAAVECAEHMVSTALSLSSEAAVTIEKIKLCIQIKEQHKKQAEEVVAEAQGKLHAAANAANAAANAVSAVATGSGARPGYRANKNYDIDAQNNMNNHLNPPVDANAHIIVNVNVSEILTSLNQHRSDLRTLVAACAMVQAAYEAATAATLAAKAGLQAIKPVQTVGLGNNHIRGNNHNSIHYPKNQNDDHVGFNQDPDGNNKNLNGNENDNDLKLVAAPEQPLPGLNSGPVIPSRQPHPLVHVHAPQQVVLEMASPTPSPLPSASASPSASISSSSSPYASPSMSLSASASAASSSSPALRRKFLKAAAAARFKPKLNGDIDDASSQPHLHVHPMGSSRSASHAKVVSVRNANGLEADQHDDGFNDEVADYDIVDNIDPSHIQLLPSTQNHEFADDEEAKFNVVTGSDAMATVPSASAADVHELAVFARYGEANSHQSLHYPHHRQYPPIANEKLAPEAAASLMALMSANASASLPLPASLAPVDSSIVLNVDDHGNSHTFQSDERTEEEQEEECGSLHVHEQLPSPSKKQV